MNSQEVNVSIYKHDNWRAARYLVIAFALGGWFTGTVLAQTAIRNRSSKTTTSQKADPPASAAAELSSPDAQSAMPSGTNIGNYNVSGSVNLGWRYSNITGSQANYDTFVNLQQGPRLLNFSLNAYSLNHKGRYFDSMSLTGFGFGGDPVDVVRLNMTKNKWYDFAATYRRYKYFWNYNLLANPLNPVNTAPFPTVPITNTPHLMDLSHRMTDLQLKLLPQSAVHFRLGYARSSEFGPSFTSDGAAAGILPIDETGALTLLSQDFKTTEDNYHAGIDFVFLPRTTLSYDEYVQHYKEDTYATDGAFNYQVQLPSGGAYVPVDLGLVFSPGTPCSEPVTNPNTTPPTANPGFCDGNVLATHAVRPRGTIPTEHFGFQTTYFRNFNMTGAISYSSGSQNIDNPINYNTWIGMNTRTHAMGSKDIASTKAKRIIVNGDWNAVYDVTAKFRIMDSFAYNNFRIPGIFNFNVLNYFAPAGTGDTLSEAGALAQALAQNPSEYLNTLQTACPPDCPEHNSGSAGPDLATGYSSTYLAQEFRSNTFELAYDFTRYVGAHIGYRYTKRKIHDAYQQFYTAEIFYPGGTVGAARGDCASGCSPGPVPGSLEFKGLDTAVSDTSHNLVADIDGNSALFGLWIRPTSNFRTSFDMELFSADEAFTRITPRLMRHYQISSTYTPISWATVTGVIDIVDGSDDVFAVNNKSHDRSYSISTMFMPNSRFSFDLSYNYNNVYTQAFDCFTTDFGSGPPGSATCPYSNSTTPSSEVSGAALSTYESRTNFASADLMVKPVKQLTFELGYAGSFVRGTPNWYNPDNTTFSEPFLDPLTPWGPLRFNYQSPYVRMDLNLYKGLSYTAAWNYYGYNSRADNNPAGLAPLGTQDFNGNNMTMSAQYRF